MNFYLRQHINVNGLIENQGNYDFDFNGDQNYLLYH